MSLATNSLICPKTRKHPKGQHSINVRDLFITQYHSDKNNETPPTDKQSKTDNKVAQQERSKTRPGIVVIVSDENSQSIPAQLSQSSDLNTDQQEDDKNSDDEVFQEYNVSNKNIDKTPLLTHNSQTDNKDAKDDGKDDDENKDNESDGESFYSFNEDIKQHILLPETQTKPPSYEKLV